MCGLLLTTLQQANNIDYISPTEEFLMLMLPFLGEKAAYQEPNIKSLLAQRVQGFFYKNKHNSLKLDGYHKGNWAANAYFIWSYSLLL